MPPVLVDHVVTGDVAKPEVERHRGIAQVFRQTLIGFEEHLLNDVARVDSAFDRAVEPVKDHPPERFAVPLPEPLRR
jgi:hypothetical protein